MAILIAVFKEKDHDFQNSLFCFKEEHFGNYFLSSLPPPSWSKAD